ncbi:hypothetical protein [Streptomyces sp. NPDC059092]|uniref:hypothetical protein n=1 Tax=Streptomyces sp. NPDC059092 TaxID=3346725 RepID=UPI00368F8D29
MNGPPSARGTVRRAVLAANGGGDGGGSWTFRDDRGTNVTADGVPKRIAARLDEAQLSDAGRAPLLEQLAAAVEKSKRLPE